MITTNPLPLTTFSQVDYPIELENMYDTQTNQQITSIAGETITVTYSGSLTLTIGQEVKLSVIRVVDGLLSIIEIPVQVLSVPAAGVFTADKFDADLVEDEFVSYYPSSATTPKDVTFGLQPSGGTTTFFKIRANSQGKGKVFIGEILRQYLPEFLAPKDYEVAEIEPNNKLIAILFNGAVNNIVIFYGGKFIDVFKLNNSLSCLGQNAKIFQEQLIGYFNLGESLFVKVQSSDLSIGENTLEDENIINLYPAIPCKNKIVLSSNYGLLPDGELIDVSVPVLAFVNRAGQYEYIRFTGSNVNKYNVQEARLKQDYASTLTNADIGLIYEGIELTLADDNTNQGFAYRIDKLEYQRCLALLMESPKAWLLVNGDLQQALEVRVKRESVVFASSFDKTYGNYTAQCEVIITQTLGQPQY
jgi:hypothetical protein